MVAEADQAGPVGEGIADVLGKQGFPRDARDLGFQPRLERGADWSGTFAPGGEAVGGSHAAHGLRDLIQ